VLLTVDNPNPNTNPSPNLTLFYPPPHTFAASTFTKCLSGNTSTKCFPDVFSWIWCHREGVVHLFIKKRWDLLTF